MRAKRYFSDIISNLKSEEVKSEFQRSYLLIVLFLLILLVAAVNYFMLQDSLIKFYGGTPVFIRGVGFLLVFLIYQILILQYLKGKLRDGSGTPRLYKYVHTMIEISFPTAIMFLMMSQLKMLSYLDSPIFLLYFLFIILSILHLDFRVSIFAGTFSAIQYVFLIYYGFRFAMFEGGYEPATPEAAHYIRAVIMVLSGAAAAFVAAELKSRIKTTFDFQEKKNELEVLFGQQVSKEARTAAVAVYQRCDRGRGCDSGGFHQGLPGVAQLQGRQCVLHLAVSHRDQHGQELSRRARAAGPDDHGDRQ